VARAAADVERAAAHDLDLLPRADERVDEVVDEQDIAHLSAVAVDRDRFARERAAQEVGDPALVLGAELVRAVDAAHAEHRGGQPEAARVVEDVLLGARLRAAVRRAGLDGPLLVDAAAVERAVDRAPASALADQREVRQRAVDLVGGRVEQGRRRRLRAQRLEHLERAGGVDVEVAARIDEARRDRGLPGEVELRRRAGERGAEPATVADVGDHRFDPGAVGLAQPGQVSLDAGARQVVVDPDAVPGAREVRGEVGADEAGAAEDRDGAEVGGHSASPRCESSARIASTRSTGRCDASQLASSASPASSSIVGS